MGGSDLVSRVAEILTQAGQTHHHVYAITDGADDDWASWYSDWLSSLSELPNLLEGVVRSERTSMLVLLAREYRSEDRDADWPEYFAERLEDHFGG